MKIMKYDAEKLQRLSESADDAHVALIPVSERMREARQQRTTLQSQIERDVRTYGRAARETTRAIADLTEEIDRLQVRHARLQQQFSGRRGIAQACEEWARTHGGMRGGGSVIQYPGQAGWIR